MSLTQGPSRVNFYESLILGKQLHHLLAVIFWLHMNLTCKWFGRTKKDFQML